VSASVKMADVGCAVTFNCWMSHVVILIELHDPPPGGQQMAVVFAAVERHFSSRRQQKLFGRPCPHGEKAELGHSPWAA